MSATKPAAEQAEQRRSEPRPWLTPEDAKGWRLVGVGRRHPRRLEFDIAAILRRRDPLGLGGDNAAENRYQPVARTVAEQLRAMSPAAAAAADVRQALRSAFVRHFATQSLGIEAEASLVEEIWIAWRNLVTFLAAPMARR